MKNQAIDMRKFARLSAFSDEHVRPVIAEQLEAIAALSQRVVDGKNAADDANTAKTTIWSHIFTATDTIAKVTAECPEDRFDLFTDAFAEYVIPKNGPDGKPLKMTTAGQYASTARKLLCDVVTANKEPDLSEYAGLSVKEVRELWRNKGNAVAEANVKDIGKMLRYVAKNGGEAGHKEIADLLVMVTDVYNPVKAKQDKKSKKGQAAANIPDLQQQPPAEGGDVETVAGVADTLADNGTEEADRKQAVGE